MQNVLLFTSNKNKTVILNKTVIMKSAQDSYYLRCINNTLAISASIFLFAFYRWPVGVIRNMRQYSLIPADLKIIMVLVLLTDLFILLPFLSNSPIRTVLGLPMVLFLPGYALIAALFPAKDDLDGIERLALSFGLSIAVVPLMGLGLNYTPWGIRLVPVLIAISLFTLGMSIIAISRRKGLGENAFSVHFREMYTSLRNEVSAKPQSRLDRILSIVLVISILLSVVTLIYVVVTPKQGEKFTEFYILGPQGMADNYNTRLVRGDSVDVIVGVVNHEYDQVNYSLELRLDNEIVGIPESYRHISLEHNATWEQPLLFTPDRTGNDMKLQYLLYRKDNMSEPYRDLHLWITVMEDDSPVQEVPAGT